MVEYILRPNNRASRLLEVNISVQIEKPVVKLRIPAWRPGRYELQNYAKNIMYFEVENEKGEKLEYHKEDRNTWVVSILQSQTLSVKYKYYCYQLDAGGSYIDDDLVYVNPVNCCMQVMDYGGVVDLCLDVPLTYQISCGLSFSNLIKEGQKLFYAKCKSWYELYDSPIFASENLLNYSYEVKNHKFNLWFYGIDKLPNSDKTINDFIKFTEYQQYIFDEFPFEEYHFQFWILPFKYYHGVEHRNSTVIVLGDQNEFVEGKLNDDFLGVSSHELFHAWNICKIRPKELLPYDYDKESYFNTGFVAEGFTTYFGDYVLYRSGVITKEQYEKELEAVIKKHLYNTANEQCSLVESSFDLWVDGYQPSHAERKVSIYDKGAVVAMVLDAYIRKFSDDKYSLENVLKDLWFDFGLENIGYLEQDVRALVIKYGGESILSIYEECVFGKTHLETYLTEALMVLGFDLKVQELYNSDLESKGYTTKKDVNGKMIVEKNKYQDITCINF